MCKQLTARLSPVSHLLKRTGGGNQDLDHLSSIAVDTPMQTHHDITREKTTIKEHIHDGPGHLTEQEENIERDISHGGPGMSPADILLPPSASSSGGAVTKINPRTGKPLTLPPPLSLSPRDPVPIVPMPNAGTGQMISETHEEVRLLNYLRRMILS